MHLPVVNCITDHGKGGIFMKKSAIHLLLALLCLFLLAACGSDAPDAVVDDTPASEVAVAEATVEETAPTATNTMPSPATETTAPPTVTAEPTATEEVEPETEEESQPTPTVEPTLVPNPEVLASNCLNCHSDQQLLMDLASPEEVPEESESSGVG